jgi:putative ABC transport system permease protein
MPLLVSNHVANAMESLRSNRLRTALTVVGVTIGISSIIVILSLSAGATKIITDQVDQLGGTIAVVRPGAPERDSQISNLTASLAGQTIASSLTEKDVDAISKVDHVTAVAPIMRMGGNVTTGTGSKPRNIEILATTPALLNVTSLEMGQGQFFDDITNDDTAVVGEQLSIDLFGTDQSVGRTFRTHGVQFTVIGIIERQNNPINFTGIDFDHAAIINLTSGKNFNQGIASIQQITIRSDRANNLSSVVRQSDEALAKNHLNEKNYEILSGETLAKPSNELFNTVSATLVTVATVSLLVGGIGIMNIMLVGVTERTREIGIRKALGASNTHITWQFLIESLFMSLAGGVIGYFVGYLIAFGIARTVLTFDPVFSWSIVGAAFVVSLIVGLIFGLYPALRAARKDPIEALRQYL